MRSILFDGARRWTIETRDHAADPAARLHDPPAIRAMLQRVRRDPLNLARLRRFLADDHGYARVGAIDDDAVLAVIEALVRRGAVTAIASAAPHLPARDGDAEIDPPTPRVEALERPQQKVWIELEMLGEDDQPIAGERYWIELPDGSIREGTLDRRGFVHIGELDPGTCYVRFPDLDHGAWTPVSSGTRVVPDRAKKPAPEEAPAPPRSWLAIELLDDDDQPVAAERYCVELPDGSRREGVLDASGTARLEGLDPGTCRVTFPALDQDTWAQA